MESRLTQNAAPANENQNKPLPSFEELNQVYTHLNNAALVKYGKEAIVDLPETCRPEIQLIDLTLHCLLHPEQVSDKKTEMWLPQQDDDKRDILAGALLFIRNQTAKNSENDAMLVAALSSFNEKQESEMLATFANYMRIFNIPDIKIPQSLKLSYTLKSILDLIPDTKMAAIEDRRLANRLPEQASTPTQAPSTSDNASFLYRWTIGFFVSSGNNNEAKPEQKSTNGPLPRI
jgi:hypothetical protein